MSFEDMIVDTRELQKAIQGFNQLGKSIPTSALRRAGHRIGKKLVLLLLKPTATWRNKPKIKHIVRVSSSGVIIVVKVNDVPYLWVALGTKRHPISPVRARRLVFSLGYKAKSTPGSLAASSGGSFGSTVYSMGIEDHPGIKARDFHRVAFAEIEKDGLGIVKEEVQAELAKVMGI